METTAEPQAVPTAPPPSLPRYRSHKVVQAALILAIAPLSRPVGGSPGPDGDPPTAAPDGARLELELPGPEPRQRMLVSVSQDFVEKHQPKGGGYFVRYEDGYESFSPASAFERGYTPQDERYADGPVQGRPITSHHVNDANKRLRVLALDGAGPGGASHLYQIDGFNTASNPSCPFQARYGKPAEHSTLLFQNGGIADVGVNGVTHEALLAILIDRIDAFQAGPHACEENRQAVAHLRRCAELLGLRTRRRIAEGTEGKVTGN